jgi:hypothetical protein
MTHEELRTTLYGSYSAIHPEWRSAWEMRGPGALVFLPPSYTTARALRETAREFWPVARLRDLITTTGIPVAGLDEFLEGVNPAMEILVMIVESAEGKPVTAVHLYRIPDIRDN